MAKNPDDPERPTNSDQSCYQITETAVELVKSFGQPGFDRRLADYLLKAPGLRVMYAAAREQAKIPVTFPDGSVVALAPGGQNKLIRNVVEDFCPASPPAEPSCT